MEGSYLGIGSTDFLENLRGAPLASSLWTAKEIRKFRRAVQFDRPEMHPYERPWPCEMGIVGYLSDGSDGVPSFEPGTWHVQRPTSREAPPTGWLRSFDGTNHESKRFCRRTTRLGRARRPGSERRARVMPSTACAARRSPPFLHIGRFQGTSGPFGSATSMPKEMPASSGTDRFLGRWAVMNER